MLERYMPVRMLGVLGTLDGLQPVERRDECVALAVNS
jgi:hypothetical protein